MKLTRRRALQGAIASGWLAAKDLPAPAVAAAATSKGICGLAIGTYGLPDLSVVEAVELVGGIGYDAIELTTFPGSSGDPAGALEGAAARAEVVAALERHGLRVCALMADLRPESSDEKHLEQLRHLRDLIELAREISPTKPPIIQTVLGGKDWESSRGLFRDRLANWNQLLADLKGTLAIKPHRGQAMSTPSEAIELLTELGNPRRLRICYDYSHYAFRGDSLSIAKTVEEALPLTAYVAVKDAIEEEGKVRFALAGSTDSWDQAEVIRAFHAGGYRGDFCCEVSSQIWRNNPSYDPIEATKACYEKMNAAFERAGVSRDGE